jgi:acyl-CoA thioester hydrolase
VDDPRSAELSRSTPIMNRVFTHRLRIRYHECDQQGVVFNAHYLVYYDVALTELSREAYGGHAKLLDQGADLVVAEARLRYLAGARFDEVLEIDLPIVQLGETSMTVLPKFRLGTRVLVEGEVRHVFVDLATRRKTPIPEDIRARLEPFVIKEEMRG